MKRVSGVIAIFLSGLVSATTMLSVPKALNASEVPWRLKGFTGPNVPALQEIRGDYCNTGVRTAEGRTDIPLLLSVLRNINATDYMHLIWTETRYPGAWSDFEKMAPEFQKAGINLWLYLTPPTEGVPDPFGADYIKWGVECAKIASRYPVVKGIVIDDFGSNTNFFSPFYCKRMMYEAHKIAPKMSLLVVGYYSQKKNITKHVEQGAVDGIVFPYFGVPKNHTDMGQLLPQIRSFRSTLDAISLKTKSTRRVPLVVMIYATKLSNSPDAPTPAYVKSGIDIGLTATRNGLVNGVITYCLPKGDPTFIQAVADGFSGQ